MARKTSRQAIEKRIRKSLRYLGEGDAEDAIYNIAPIIDVIAKDRYPGIKSVGERVKKYIFDEQTLIYYLSTQGKITLPDGVRIVMVDHHNTEKPVGGNGGELSDFIYHNIRCAQSHDGEIDYEFVDIGRQFGIGRQTFEGDGAPLNAREVRRFKCHGIGNYSFSNMRTGERKNKTRWGYLALWKDCFSKRPISRK